MTQGPLTPPTTGSAPPLPAIKSVIVEAWEKKLLYGFFGCFLLGMFIFLGNELSTQEQNFQEGLELSKETYEKIANNPESTAYRPDVSLLYAFQFSRALEAAHIRTATVILGTLIVCLGCIVVVYGVEASYQLTVNPQTDSKSSLSTSSPGLVLITLGVAVIIIAQINRSTITTDMDWVVPNSATQTVTPHEESPNASQFPVPATH
jgi:hypothetical protein